MRTTSWAGAPHLPGAFAANHGAGGVVFDPLTQRIYASDPVHHRIDMFNTRGQLVQTLDPLGLHTPTFLALDAAGNRLFVDDNGARIVELSLSGSGQIIPFAHTPFPAIFSLGDVAFDAANGNLYVSRSLTSNQTARGASPVVVYSTRTGRRVILAASFPGIGSFATGIAYDPANGDLYVGGEQTTGSSPTAFMASYTPQGRQLSGAGGLPGRARQCGARIWHLRRPAERRDPRLGRHAPPCPYAPRRRRASGDVADDEQRHADG
jgi:DNA-binding beta-propeller fold protein YncE